MGAGIYIHWPFCASKCPYCDFNIYLNNKFDEQRWISAYLTTLDYYAQIWDEREIHSIYFGGGTPSLMRPQDVQAIIDHVAKNWKLSDGIEITLEANPTSTETDKFQQFKAAGVNRLSLGVQSFEDKWLKFLGRLHDANEVRRAVTCAQAVFDRMSLDLIYAMPDQSIKMWEEELKAALPFISSHVSAYQLTIKEGTAFYQKHKRGDFVLPMSDEAADFYTITNDILGGAGYPLYEVSNYARARHDSRHNLTYWRYQDYLGIGPSAHGRVSVNGIKHESIDFKALDRWINAIESTNGNGAEAFTPLSKEEQFEEMVMMGLRLAKGLNIKALKEKTGLDFLSVIDAKKIETLRQEGWIVLDEKNAQLTMEGMLRADSVLSYLLT